MEVIRKAVSRKSNVEKNSKYTNQNDELLGKNCMVSDGVTFSMKYLGSTLVEEINEEESYGSKIASKAIKSIVNMTKSVGKKLSKVALSVSADGIRVVDLETGAVISDLSIYRINFCTADRRHGKVFAFIGRNTTNETMECQAFLCTKRKMAEAVTLSVAEAFKIAEEWELHTNTITDNRLKENYNKILYTNSINCGNNNGSLSPSSSTDGLSDNDSSSDSSNDSSSMDNLKLDVDVDDFSQLAQTRIQVHAPFTNKTASLQNTQNSRPVVSWHNKGKHLSDLQQNTDSTLIML